MAFNKDEFLWSMDLQKWNDREAAAATSNIDDLISLMLPIALRPTLRVNKGWFVIAHMVNNRMFGKLYYKPGQYDDHMEHPFNAGVCYDDRIGLYFKVAMRNKRHFKDQSFTFRLQPEYLVPQVLTEVD